jgi:hypothetical protein
MKLWKQLVLGSLVLAFTLSLGFGTADAATKKKKKKEAPKVEKKQESKVSVKNTFVSGTNIWGRAGLLFSDTSDVLPVGHIEGSAYLTYQSLASLGIGSYTYTTDQLGIPFGFHIGVVENVDLYASGNFVSTRSGSDVPNYTSTSTNSFVLNGGGKYHIATTNKNLSFSAGGDLTIPTQGGSVIFTPRGTVTYVLGNGFLLNGELGVAIDSTTYAVADAGIGIPVNDRIAVMAEIGANQAGYLNSQLAGGIRYAFSNIKLQGLVGLPLNGGGAMIGGGIILASQ